MRVRRRGPAKYLTVKQGIGLTRAEVEVEVTDQQFKALWPLTAARRVSKRRHYVAAAGTDIEVDVYSGGLAGLIIAEAEFAGEGEAGSFEPPDWVDEEVTGQPDYANKNLATRGLPDRDPQAGTENGDRAAERPALTAMLERQKKTRGSGASPDAATASLHGLGAELNAAVLGLDQHPATAQRQLVQERCLDYGAALIASAESLFQGHRLLAQVRPSHDRIVELISEQELDQAWMRAPAPIASWRETFADNHRRIIESAEPEAGLFDRFMAGAGLAADLHDWLASHHTDPEVSHGTATFPSRSEAL